MAMTPQRWRFVHEYAKDLNGTQAAIRAGYAEKSAGDIAHGLLKDAEIVLAVEQRKADIARVAELDAVWLLKQWMAIASADPNELMQLRRVNCRHCHGFGHAYQWTQAEYAKATEDAVKVGKEAPDFVGGFGFRAAREPNPACPECDGLGVEDVHMLDTRTLRGDAKTLYAGVKKTKEGITLLTQDQDAARAHLARYLGLSIERKEISGPGGKPLVLAALKAEDLSDDQLAAILGQSENDNQQA